MPNLGPTELIIIALLIILLFGFKKLPDAARSVGRSMRVFKSEMDEMKTENHDKRTVTGQVHRDADVVRETRETRVEETRPGGERVTRETITTDDLRDGQDARRQDGTERTERTDGSY